MTDRCVAGESSRLTTRRLVFHDDGHVEQVDPPVAVPTADVVVLQPYGALFFATAQSLRDQLPVVTDDTRHAVVVLRLRGSDDAGSTVMDILKDYAPSLPEQDSRLAVVTDSERLVRQLELSGTAEQMGRERIYRSNGFIGESTRHAHDDTATWIARRKEQEHADAKE